MEILVNYTVCGTGIIRSDETEAGTPGAKVVYLVDCCTGMSITNGAEIVVQETAAKYPGYLICYRDTDKRWSELKALDGAFHAFGPWRAWHPTDEEAELAIASHDKTD